MSCFKKIYCGVLVLFCGQLLQAQNDAGNIKRKPFTIRGQIGAASNFYSSNETSYSRPSFTWNVNANFTAQVNEVALPFSFVINQFNKSNASAYFQGGISPTYKWAKLHLGDRSILFSPLTFGGQTFRGVGIELNPKQFRFAAFYGRLNKAFNEDTSAGRSRSLQYSRIGYGVKIGVGNSSRFLDVLYFHAKDDSASASMVNTGRKNFVRAQENSVIGTSFKVTMAQKLILTGDLAISGLIPDLSSGNNNLDSSHKGLKKFINNFLPNNRGTIASYAGQSSLSYYSAKFSTSFGYRRIEPNFTTLGTPYLLNNVETITLTTNHSIAKGKLNINTSLSKQHDNLDKNHTAESQTQVRTINATAMLNQHLNLSVNYSGYNINQKNGNRHLPDSLRLNDSIFFKQRVTQINVSPSYYFNKGNNLHLINGNVSLQSLKDKNLSKLIRSNSNNLSTTVNYTLSFIKQALNFSLGYLFSRYKQDVSSYTSNGATVGTSARLLKNKSLNLQGNVSYFINKYSSLNTQKNITYAANIGYNVKRHAFHLFANYISNKPDNAIIDAVNKTFPYAVATQNFSGGVSYNYSIN